MWKWLYYNSPTVQAVCAIMALIGLAFYAWDTRKIRVATLAQSEASRRPFFELTERRVMLARVGEAVGVGIYELRNSGVGIGLDVGWQPLNFGVSRDHTSPMPKPLESAVPGAVLTLRLAKNYVTLEDIQSMKGVAVTYTDTAGKQYFQMFGVRADGKLRNIALGSHLSKIANHTNKQLRRGEDRTWQGDTED